VRDFFSIENFRNDADHSASRRERGIGHRAHESDASTSVDQRHSILGQQSPEFFGRLLILTANPEA